ncbi:MAG TPA: GAF domain-containing protein [Pseudonocardiaceae bacterium]|jgi:hypothetical protein|nr:GAF domain-containing protein [Pseudonocardiaceae bacterium]
MADTWLLIETFGGHRREPTVMGVGSVPKRMVPLRTVLGRGRYLTDVRDLVAEVATSRQLVRTTSTDRQRQLIGHPLKAFTGRVHGVFVWLGRPDAQPPARDPAGAWHFNLSTNVIGGSDDLLDLYGVAPEDRRTQRTTAEAFGRLVTNADEAAALAMLVRSEPGAEHQATWTVRRDDGALRAANFACRTVAERSGDRVEVVLRGITHDIGAAENVPAAPPATPMLLAAQVLAAEQVAGQWRAIVNLRTLALLRWIDDPMPGIAWQHDAAHRPGIHRRDLAAAIRMSNTLASTGRVTAVLRCRSTDGGWTPVSVSANLMLLDQHTTAALVTLRLPDRAANISVDE